MSGTDLPEVLDSTHLAPDTESCDVVVIGFGIAGGSAALEAARSGAHVVLLERAAVHGGTSAMSGGAFYLGGGTAVQRATGHEDSVEAMVDYLTAVSCEPDPAKIRAYCEDSVEHFDWLESLGFEFERSYYDKKAVIQPGTEGLMYTGNEKVWPFIERAIPAPRGHKVPVAGDTEGTRLVMDLLRDRLAEAGVDVRYETGANALVVSTGSTTTEGSTGTGDVVGVQWRRFAETGVIRAKAVILAAGGFVMNKDMVAKFTPHLAEKPFVLGTTYDDGLGIRLGESVGGATAFMEEAFITAPFYPPSRLVTGLLVNREGRRFVAEDSYHARTSAHVMDQPGHAAYLIVDSEHIEHPVFPLAPFIDGWETVEEMEAGLELPTGSLVATLAAYNENAARGEDPDFHKQPEWLAPQDTGPWGAFDLTLGRALYAGFTMGGLVTDVDGQVRRADGTPIAGLYAAGACASNIAQDAKGYASGTQLGEGSFFGRRAGRHAATR
ncbi:FAD-binding protein [Nocardioides jensenii]|uniref:FAD-binding protein n=1 Tax=Nocardioides jensenii TaxID=1843 RepID=UPI00082E86A3|nr:FAD-binding protein [Nocardioides jensenii]